MDAGVITALIGAVAVMIAAALTTVGVVTKNRTDRKSALDARIDARVERELESAWKAIDAQKGKIDSLTRGQRDLQRQYEDLQTRYGRTRAAIARILRAIAAQWPDPHGPNLDPRDLAELEDAVPSAWIRRGEGAAANGPLD